MFADILDGQAEVAGTLVQIKRAALENSRLVAVVQVLEVDEVDAEQMQVPNEARKFFDIRDGGSLGFERLVLHDKGVNFIPHFKRENFTDAFDAQLFDRSARLARAPAFKRTEFGLQRSPVGLGQFGFVTEQRLDGI